MNPRTVWATCLAGGVLLTQGAQAEVIGHWTFNEGEGAIAVDVSTNSNHGMIFGDARYVPSPGGFALDLDGVNDTVSFGLWDIFNFSFEDFSVEIWVAIEGPQGSNNFGLFGKGGGSWVMGYEHNGGTSARYNVQICGGSGCGIAKESEIGAAMPFGTYRHVVFTKSTSSEIRLYVDGIQVSTGGGGFQPIFTEPLLEVRAGTGGGSPLNGQIDEIRIHDAYLSSNEVFTAANDGPSTNASSAIAISTNIMVQGVFSTEIVSQDKLDYRLECATDLLTVNWKPEAITTEGTGTNLFLYDAVDVDTNKFYRVAVE